MQLWFLSSAAWRANGRSATTATPEHSPLDVAPVLTGTSNRRRAFLNASRQPDPGVARRHRVHDNSQTMTNNGSIISDPAIMTGKPVVAGTRITVELILEKLAAGESIDQLLEAHPRLTREAIYAALKFAADALRADVVYPTEGSR